MGVISHRRKILSIITIWVARLLLFKLEIKVVMHLKPIFITVRQSKPKYLDVIYSLNFFLFVV